MIEMHVYFCHRYKFSWSLWLGSLFKAHSFTWIVDSNRKKNDLRHLEQEIYKLMYISYNCLIIMLQLCNMAEKSDVRLTVELRSDMQSTLMSQ